MASTLNGPDCTMILSIHLLVIAEVFQRQDSAFFVQVSDQLLGRLTLVKLVGAELGNPLQCPGQILSFVEITGLPNVPGFRIDENGPHACVRHHHVLLFLQLVGHTPRGLDAVPGHVDRRLDQAGPGHRGVAVSLLCLVVTSDLSGDCHGQWASLRQIRIPLEHVLGGSGWSSFSSSQGVHLFGVSVVNCHDETAANTHALRAVKSVAEKRCYRRIHRRSISSQNLSKRTTFFVLDA